MPDAFLPIVMLHVAFYPSIVSVSGCDPWRADFAEDIGGHVEGFVVPESRADATWNCPNSGSGVLILQIVAQIGLGVAPLSVTVGGRDCVLPTDASNVTTQSGANVTLRCTMDQPAGVGVLVPVVVTVKDGGSFFPLPSTPRSLVSFALPNITQVRCASGSVGTWKHGAKRGGHSARRACSSRPRTARRRGPLSSRTARAAGARCVREPGSAAPSPTVALAVFRSLRPPWATWAPA